MVKNFRIYALSLWACSSCFGDSAQTSPSIDELKSKATLVEAAFRSKCAEYGYHFLTKSDIVKIHRSSNIYYQENTIKLRSDNYWAEFLEKNGALISFGDENAYDQFSGPRAPKYTTLTLPKWSPEKVISLAKPFLPILLGDRHVLLAEPKAKYDHPLGGREGWWSVDWSRIDSKGHPFEYDEHVSISISESAGPLGGNVYIIAKYIEQPGEPLAASGVQEKAWKAAQATLNWGPAKSIFELGHLDPKPRIVELEVVKPNHLLEQKDVPTHPDLNARLAWVFWYARILDNNPKQIQSVGVWVDAYTGEILGGDVGM